MLFKTLIVGPFDTNCYIVGSEQTGEALVVDPGAEPKRVWDEMVSMRLRPVLIVSTHGHFDHTGAVRALRELALAAAGHLGPPDYAVHAEDAPQLSRGEQVRKVYSGYQDPPTPEKLLVGGEVFRIGELEARVLHTPGHTPGSICLHIPTPDGGVVFTGDTLFQMSVGRTDFGGNRVQELESIRDALLVLPDSTRVYPGHGPSTAIGEERVWNPFLVDFLSQA
jgi:glyoxylase-like metal-dependent hydrolase (beta-lactamase superfamily II)